MILSLGNAFRIGSVVAITLLGLVVEILVVDLGSELTNAANPIRMKRRCLECRGLFIPEAKPIVQPLCGKCGYDLTGNTSGVCPECGWKLPRRIRAKLKIS